MQPPVFPSQASRKKSFDLSIALVVIVAGFIIWGAAQAAHMMQDAEVGLIRFEKAQKDLFIDAGIVEASRRVSTRSAVAALLRRETVMVVSRITRRRSAVGSGIVLRNDSHGMVILTAKHVVRHHGPVTVVLSSQKFVPILAEYVVASPTRDLALVYTAASDPSLRSVRFASRDLQTRDTFVVMGHPGKRSWVASPGIAERHLHYVFLYCPQCDNGDSGAGVFNSRGELAGILVSKVFVDAPNWRTGKRLHVVAFFMEPLDAIRAFLVEHNVHVSSESCGNAHRLPRCPHRTAKSASQ